MNLQINSVDYFRNLVSEPSEFLIVAHYNPDGDAIGSSLALFHFLKARGEKVNVLIPNDIPSFLKWMPGSESMINYQSDPDAGNMLIKAAEVIFCMDFNSFSRVKLFQDELANSSAIKILIDHHLQPENEFDLAISVTEVSSTSELLYHVLNEAGMASEVSAEMAECLFTGIMTDTGSFSYACNRSDTFLITSRLIETGISVEKIHRQVYDTYSESRMRLLGYCLGKRLKVLPQFATAYIWLTKSDLEKYEYQPGDTEGVVNYALSIENVSLAALFTESDDRIRVSLRSKGDFSVNDLARIHFNGGGHKNAAGADSFDTMENTLTSFEELLEGYKSTLSGTVIHVKPKEKMK